MIKTNVGDRYVMEAMRQGGYNLGGEQSGHLIFRDSSTTGDGILAGLHLLEIMIEKAKPLSDLKKIIKKLPQVLKSFEVKEKIPLEELPNLKKKLVALKKNSVRKVGFYLDTLGQKIRLE